MNKQKTSGISAIVWIALVTMILWGGACFLSKPYYAVELERQSTGEKISIVYPAGVPDLFHDLYISIIPIAPEGTYCLCFFYKTQQQIAADYALIVNCETLEMHVLTDRTKDPIEWWIYTDGIPTRVTNEEAKAYLDQLGFGTGSAVKHAITI